MVAEHGRPRIAEAHHEIDRGCARSSCHGRDSQGVSRADASCTGARVVADPEQSVLSVFESLQVKIIPEQVQQHTVEENVDVPVSPTTAQECPS